MKHNPNDMSEQSHCIFWQVLEFTKRGAESRYFGSDFDESRTIWDQLKSGYWVEIHGRDPQGRPIPGQPMTNIPLGHKAGGIEFDPAER